MTCLINPFESARKVPFDLDGRILITTEGCELIHLTLQAGERLPLHDQPFDVVFFVLEGDGILQADAEEYRITAGTSIGMKKGIPRGWSNPGPVALTLLVIKLTDR